MNDLEMDEEFAYENALQRLIEKEEPDVLFMHLNEYERLAQNLMLDNLEIYMKKDNVDTSGLIPGMLDHVRELGGGQIYGIPTALNSQVIYYNKDIFDQFSIDYPTDQMLWEDILQLARRFPVDGTSEERLYGLKAGYNGDLFELTGMLAAAEGLSHIDPASMQMTIYTDSWKRIVQTALDAINSQTFYIPDQDSNNVFNNDNVLGNPFITGRLAMSIDNAYLAQQINRASSYIKDEDAMIKNWDIVTMPIHAKSPDQGSHIWYNDIFAISKDSKNKDAAWKFISYVTGSDFAKLRSKKDPYRFSTHTQYIADEEGRNFAAFYKLKPSRHQMQYRRMGKLSPQIDMMLNEMMREEFKAIQNGTKSVDEALKLLQEKGDELLAKGA